MTTIELIDAALAERNRILIAMDQEAAKAFIVRHGGTAPKHLDYEIVLHLARWDVETIADDLRQSTRVFLARAGKYGIAQMHPNSPYVRAALDLIFPKTLTDQYIREMGLVS